MAVGSHRCNAENKEGNEREAICAVSVEPTWHFKEKQTTNM